MRTMRTINDSGTLERSLSPVLSSNGNQKFTREQIFCLKYTGQELPEEDIFRSIDAYSPSGLKKKLPYTAQNERKYKKFKNSLKKYCKQAV